MKNIQEIVNINKYNSYGKLKKLKLLDEISLITSFLDDAYDTISWSQRFWHIKNDNLYLKTCSCGKKLIWDNKHLYHKTCGNNRCIQKKTKKSIKNYPKNEVILIIKKYTTSGALLKLHNSKAYIVELTSFLDKTYNDISWSQRFWHIKNDVYDIIECKNRFCKNPARYTRTYKYITCSITCQKTHSAVLTSNNNKNRDYKKENRKDLLIKYKSMLGDEYEIVGDIYDKKFRHKQCNSEFIINISTMFARLRRNHILCEKCNPKHKLWSSIEKELVKYIIDNHTGDIIQNDRSIISPKELDIYIPNINLAIEINGLYWHSELFKDKTFHMLKTIECNNKNIQLLQIWEDDWVYRKEIVKSIISGHFNSHQKIFARKCIIKSIKSIECKKFLEQNHMQGYTSASIYYGLYFENELVQIMSFRNSNTVKQEWEISRLCTKLHISVIGGVSKLFKRFLSDINFKLLFSYSSADYFSGSVYEMLGMEKLGMTVSGFRYIKSVSDILSRQQCQKKKLIKQGYDKNKTEHQIMLDRGYLRIYDSGNHKFVMSHNPINCITL